MRLVRLVSRTPPLIDALFGDRESSRARRAPRPGTAQREPGAARKPCLQGLNDPRQLPHRTRQPDRQALATIYQAAGISASSVLGLREEPWR